MSLFPQASFQLLLDQPGGVLVPGTIAQGTVVLEAPNPIARAEHVDLFFRTNAWAGYGSGKNRNVVKRSIFTEHLRTELPKGHPLPAGRHHYPFRVNLPYLLPTGFRGPDCAIEHVIELRLDVDWALDPVTKLAPVVRPPPAEGRRTPLTMRSPQGFHQSVVLEITLASSVVVEGEPLEGQVALRGGHGARFDGVDLKLMSVATIAMGRGDRRKGAATGIHIPDGRLRAGEPVRFVFPSPEGIPPSFTTSFIDHALVLEVSLDIPWALDPKFELPIVMLPRGSVLHGETGIVAVGSQRLRQLASWMAQATGLREGRPPVLVEGAVGTVGLRVTDGPRDGKLGVDVDFTFPDVELGIDFRPLGLLDGFRDSPLLPPRVHERYLLRCRPESGRSAPDDATLIGFFATVFTGFEGASELRMSDHHLGVHLALADDSSEAMGHLGRDLVAKAKAVGEAIAALPFPAAVASARPAWQATAAEQAAVLVPTGPSLRGLALHARVVGGEQRGITATLRTVWAKEGPRMRVDVDLTNAPLPKSAWSELSSERAGSALTAARAVFPDVELLSTESAVLERDGFADDPRALLPGLEAFFAWLLEVRGERRADAPYR